MKIEFTNVYTVSEGCGCCGGSGKGFAAGPFVIETDNKETSVEEHANIAFGSVFCRVVSFDHKIIEEGTRNGT